VYIVVVDLGNVGVGDDDERQIAKRLNAVSEA
jgi:hypothetical protein